MTKVFKSFLAIVVVLTLTLTLVGCGFVSKAEKLAEDFEAGEKFSLADIKDKMGDPTSEAVFAGTGVVIWIDGCENMEEAQAKWDEGDKMGALVVGVAANNVISVKFIPEASEEDAK